MGDERTGSEDPRKDRFPFATALATLLALFLFFGLVLVAYFSPNYLGGNLPAPTSDPAAKLQDLKPRNQAAIDGTDPAAKMSVGRATAEILSAAEQSKDDKHKHGRLPFPVEPKTAPRAEKAP